MSYLLIVRRVYQEELIDLLSAKMMKDEAEKKLHEISLFPGAGRTGHVDNEIWFEIKDRNGDLVGDPVCFSPEWAMPTLVRTGVSVEQASRLMSQDYADQFIQQLHQSLLRQITGIFEIDEFLRVHPDIVAVCYDEYDCRGDDRPTTPDEWSAWVEKEIEVQLDCVAVALDEAPSRIPFITALRTLRDVLRLHISQPMENPVDRLYRLFREYADRPLVGYYPRLQLFKDGSGTIVEGFGPTPRQCSFDIILDGINLLEKLLEKPYASDSV